MVYQSNSIESNTFQLEQKIHKEAKCALAVGVVALLVLGVAGGLMGYGNIIKFPVKPLCLGGYATAGLGLALFSLSMFCIHQACKSQKNYFKILQNDSPQYISFDNLPITDLIECASRNPETNILHLVEKAKKSPIPLDQIPQEMLTPFLEECAKQISHSSKDNERSVFINEYTIVEKIFSHSDQKPLLVLTGASVKFWEKYHHLLSDATNRCLLPAAEIKNPDVRRLYLREK